MELYLLRHGIAEEPKPGGTDADRELTPEGRRKLRLILQLVAQAGVRPELILSSPLKRAWQTAEMAKRQLNCTEAIARSEALMPGADPQEAWDEVRAHKSVESLLIVGHDPLFSHLAAFLLGAASGSVEFKKGGIMRIDFGAFGNQPRGMLRWYVTPRLVENGA